MSYNLSALDAALLLLGAAILFKLTRQRNQFPKPPGPKGYPIIGNLLDLPSSFEWEAFAKWGDMYGTYCYNPYLDV